MLFLVLAACGDNRHIPDAASIGDASATDANEPLAFMSGPVFSFPESANAPLSGRIELATNRPTRISLRITSANRSYTVTRSALETTHSVPVLELRADTLHRIIVTVTDAEGTTLVAEPLDAMTPAISALAPTFAAEQLVPALIEPGITLAAMNTFVFAIDRDGAYVWFIDLKRGVGDVTLLPSGNFLIPLRNSHGAIEIDAFGTVLREWRAANSSPVFSGQTPVALDSFHHELSQSSNGEFVTLSTERREFANYPTSESDPTPRTSPVVVVGDAVAVFADDGTLRETHSLFDVLDPYRVGYDSFSSYWSAFYGEPTLDWSHANAVVRDPSDNGFVVSVRHQDAIVKLDSSGHLVWILGTHDNWSAAFAPFLLTPVGTPFAFSFHQHAPKILANGNILVFDNGNYRVSPPTPGPMVTFSRAVEFAVDPITKQVRQVWEFAPTPSIFVQATGDVDVAETTGNVIVTFGLASRLIEVTHTTPPVEVFRLQTSGTFYRSQRVPSLYRN